MRSRFILLILFLLTACTPHLIPKPDPTQIQPTSIPPVETRPITYPTQNEYSNMPSNLQNLIEQAKADLATRLSVSITDIIVLEAKEVAWSNSSLGCPQPGMAYADVITLGYLIRLNANNQDYEYHAGKSSEVFLCENPTPPVPDMPGDT